MKDHIVDTQNRIVSKLRSEQGASITFALLLFLVCAALSAVILVAATTASGRMAGIAETDQRYYSVTSAAEFIADIVDGQTVTAVWFKEDNASPHFITKPANSISEADFGETGAMVEPEVDTAAESGVKDIDTLPVNGSLNNGTAVGFLSKLANLVIDDNVSILNWTIRSTSDTPSSTLNTDSLAVSVEGKLNEDKNVAIDVYNALNGPYNNNDFKPYTLVLELSTQKRTNISLPITEVNGKKIDHATEVSWNLSTIRTPYDISISN